jgi:hypothetical protein
VDLWRLTVKPGDRVTINFAALSNQSVKLCLLPPSIDDFTLQDADCWQPLDTDYTQGNTKRQTSRVLATGGRWTVAIGHYYCVSSGGINVRCNYPAQYEMTAYVRSATRTTLRATPNLVRIGGKVTVRGAVSGAARGNIAIQTSQGGWKTLKVVKIGPKGAFAATLKATRRGKLRLRAFYPGDDQSLGSVGTAQPVTVV